MTPVKSRLLGTLTVVVPAAVLFAPALLVASCEGRPQPGSSYYDETVQPILSVGCTSQTNGCHLPSPSGTATGNLDLSSYDALQRRADVLQAYGPYPVGLLLLKAGEPVDVQVDTFDAPNPAMPDVRSVTIRTDIRHNAGAGIRLDSAGYGLLKRWITGGHTRTGVPVDSLSVSDDVCRSGPGLFPGFDPNVDPVDTASWDRFRSSVQPVLRSTCAGSNCHGTPRADLYIACGDTIEDLRWNYFIAVKHLANPASTSEILRRPLAKLRGGTFHEGGDVFASTDDSGYQAILGWADDLVARVPTAVQESGASAGLRFFANRVQPVLIRKGCMFLNCHSPSMFHDLRFRGGSQGTFSRVAITRNYELALHQLALESPNVNDSRLVAKNLYPADVQPGAGGIIHRGGSLLEDFPATAGGLPNPATPDDCAMVDADAGDLNTIPAYCVIRRWHEIERQDRLMRNELTMGTVQSLVWVRRPLDVGSPLDFDTYRPGADLLQQDATIGANGAVSLTGASRSLLGGCGLMAATADVRGPAVSWDGRRIAFAARTSATTPYRLYWANADGSMCEPVPNVAMATERDAATGILMHDFDPAWAPDGRLVFASTRGTLDCAELTDASLCGPSRTPSLLQPNANLYIREPDGAGVRVRQLTFLLNQELAPSFMSDGRVIFTAEKRGREFRQLAGRRQNLDGGDYHPLFAQRDSVGFGSATEIAELPNRNLVMVAAPLDATHGAGTLLVVNRSIGPDQSDRDPADRYYIKSSRFPVGPPSAPRGGVFRSPSPLPSGHALVSCAMGGTSLTVAAGYDFDLCDLDVRTGTLTRLAGDAGAAEIEAVAVYARPNYGVFTSRLDEANGASTIDPTQRDAQITYQDIPLFATLLFSNTRAGRPIDARVGGVDMFAELPPPATARTFADVMANVQSDAFGMYYENHRELGHVVLNGDGSAKVRIRGGTPILVRVTDRNSTPLVFAGHPQFTGEIRQRETVQFYPGERIGQGFQRRFFNGLCGGCHGSISNRELDVAVNIDVLTRASLVQARNQGPADFYP